MASLVLSGDTSGTVTLAAPSTAGTQSYTLPTAVPAANGYALTSTTAGVMSWAAAGGSPGGSTTQVQYNNAGAFAGSANMTFDGTSLTAGAFIPSSSTAPANGMYLPGAGSVTITSSSAARFTGTASDAILNSTGLPPINTNPTINAMSIGSNGWYASVTGGNNYWNHSVNGTVYNLRYQGTTVGNITINSTNVAFVTTSDYRFKENIKPMTGALARVALLKPCTYTWKSTGEAAEGFIAHELQEVIPQAVSGIKDALDEDGKIKPQGVDTSFLVATLTAAIQELTARLEALEAK